MKTIREIERKGRSISYEILEDGVVISTGTREVPIGFDRLLIPQSDGPALSINL